MGYIINKLSQSISVEFCRDVLTTETCALCSQICGLALWSHSMLRAGFGSDPQGSQDPCRKDSSALGEFSGT